MPGSYPVNHGDEQNFNDIILDDEEIAIALRVAREEKFYRLKRIEYMAELNTPREIKLYSFDEVHKIISGLITVDEYNATVIRKLCLYFSGDDRFKNEGEGYALTKGLCLFGGVGVGKTTLMRIFTRNQIQSYVLIKCRQIEDEFSRDGDIVFDQYSHERQVTTNANPFGHQRLGYCFDDIGTEPISKYYGKESNVMSEVILNRYDNELPFIQTHLTTNLTIDALQKKYGQRVTDRMRQMLNLIFFPDNAQSRRK